MRTAQFDFRNMLNYSIVAAHNDVFPSCPSHTIENLSKYEWLFWSFFNKTKKMEVFVQKVKDFFIEF